MEEKELIRLIERKNLEEVFSAIEKNHEELRKKAFAFIQELPHIKDPSRIIEAENFLPPEIFTRVLLFSVANGIKELKKLLEEKLENFQPQELDFELLRRLKKDLVAPPSIVIRYHLYLLNSFQFPDMIFPHFTVELFLHIFQKEPLDKSFFEAILKFLRTLEDEYVKGRLFLKLAQGMEKFRPVDLEVLQQAIDFQRSILWDEMRSKALIHLSEIIFGPHFTGDRVAAARMLLYAAREISTFYFKYETMKEISVKTAFKLKTELGITFAEKISNPVWSSAALFEILKASPRERKKLLTRIRDPYWKLLAKIELYPEKTESFLRDYFNSSTIFPSIKLNTLKILRKKFHGKKLKILEKVIKELNIPSFTEKEEPPSFHKEKENHKKNTTQTFSCYIEPLLLSALTLPQNQNKTILKNVLKQIIN